MNVSLLVPSHWDANMKGPRETYRLQPEQTLGDGLMVEQEAAEEQGEEHDEHAEQIGDALVADDDTEEQADHRRCQVEEHEEQHELAELGSGRHQTCHRVYDAAHDGRWDDSQGNDVEDDLGQVVGERGVVSLCPLTDEEQALRREGGERSQSGEAEEGEQEKEEAETVLEAFEVIGQAIEEEAKEDSEQDGNGVMRQHQLWVAVEVAPGATRQDEELCG